MNQYFLMMNKEEKNNILDKHKTLYDGYAVRQNIPNQQPLYVQDFANDKDGFVVNNKGEVKKYTNIGINESQKRNICTDCGLYIDVCDCKQVNENLYKKTSDFSKNQSFDYVEEVDTETENDFALAMDDETDNPELGLAMMDTEMEEGLFDFFDDDYDNIDKIMKGDEAKFHPLVNKKDERETAFSKIKKGYEPEDIDFEEIEDEIKESFSNQRVEILEMFNRFKKFN